MGIGVYMAWLWRAWLFRLLCMRSVLVSTCIACAQISLQQLHANKNRQQDLLITFRRFMVWERSSGQGCRARLKNSRLNNSRLNRFKLSDVMSLLAELRGLQLAHLRLEGLNAGGI